MRAILAAKDAYLFRAEGLGKEVEDYAAALVFLAAAFKRMEPYNGLWPKQDLFPGLTSCGCISHQGNASRVEGQRMRTRSRPLWRALKSLTRPAFTAEP